MFKPSKSSGSKKPQWRMEQCVAICDYDATSDREISFRRGDVITVLGKGEEGGYWEGFTNGQTLDQVTGKKMKSSSGSYQQQQQGRGASRSFQFDESAEGGMGLAKRGLFPTCFVSSNMKAHLPPQLCDAALALYDYKAQSPDELDMSKYDVITGVRPGPSAGWWYGFNESAKMRKGAGGGSSSASSSRPKLFPLRFVTCRIARVIAPFSEPTNSRALAIQTGDILHVTRKLDDGWWEGVQCSSIAEIYSRGINKGKFPSNLVVPNVPTTMPPMFCLKCRTCFERSAAASMASCAACQTDAKVTDELLKALLEKANGDHDGGGSKAHNVLQLIDQVEKALGVREDVLATTAPLEEHVAHPT